MTDLSSSPRQIARPPTGADPSETMGDVLASIRRLIAQGDVGPARREPDPTRRPAPAEQPPRPVSAGIAPAFVRSPRLESGEPAPLRLHRDALIPPAEVPAVPLGGQDDAPPPRPARLRLATPTDASADEAPAIATGGNRMARILRAASFPDDAQAEPRGIVPESDNLTLAPPAVPVTFHEGEVETPQAEASTAPDPALASATPTVAPAAIPDPQPPVSGNSINAAPPERTAARNAPRPVEDAGDTTALHLFAPADEDIPNGSILRSLLREAIRQELQGEMGGRFSRNLRRVIRQEVAYAIAEATRSRQQG
ncbi:hypothetical protein KTN05_13205 [Paracoccus sp. Z118]|uniref:hypothetical protein n=1 Tax=Paracoccus sp. Z118 TaxID=2851017 RepID=UPI001C2C8E21|nr:hypothetical protein [Paracoccus sp. Z118]MBV0892800.1 hypothetical protein [Paracoccus sp. Z118]